MTIEFLHPTRQRPPPDRLVTAPEHASRLSVDVLRFPEGSVSWRERVFATFPVADA